MLIVISVVDSEWRRSKRARRASFAGSELIGPETCAWI